jgi:phosphoglycerate dehydrogenase-like enzyme
MSIKSNTYHLHLESARNRPWIFQPLAADWAAAAKRHRALAKRLRVTVGQDNEILEAALKTADFMITNATPPTERFRERAPKLQWIQTTAAGVDGWMPMTWLPKDIALTNNTGAHGAKTEESCLMALLMLHARLPEVMRHQQQRLWKGVYTPSIAGMTVLVVGFGDLGQAAGRAAKKLGLNVIAVTRSGTPHKLAGRMVKAARIDSVLPQADFVIVATPLTAETRGMFHRERINRLKPGAGFINIGRSPIVDYVALRERLEKNELCGAVLDVFDQEPLPPDSPYWNSKNLLVLPHICCDHPQYIAHLLDFWFSNFERFLAGKKLKNIVDRKLGY